MVENTKIRLASIDAPESDQICLDANRKKWTCGIEARDRLAAFIKNKLIDCVATGSDAYRRTLAICTVAGANLNQWMVQQGWALAFVRYSKDYLPDEEAARAAGRGLWSVIVWIASVERLMRLQALKARPRRRCLPPDPGEREVAAVAANVLDRTFAASAPNRKWIADFTYVWTAEGWLYVAVVIDLFSRRVVGWSMSAEMTAQLVTDALVMAIWRRGKPDALLHHSDRGSQYTSEQFQKLMTDHGIICSMSRSGNVWDNAAMESFSSSLKTERTARKTYRTRDQAKADVFVRLYRTLLQS